MSNIDLAYQNFHQGRLVEAQRLVEQIIAQQPADHEAIELRGLIAQRQNQPREAEKYFRQALALGPQIAGYYSNLGQLLAQTRRLNEATVVFETAISLEPDLALAHNNLGNVLFETGKLEPAIAAFRRALQIDPNLADVHNNIGNALLARNELQEAVDEFNRAIELAPQFADAYTNLGCALEARGELTQAIAAHDRALALRPDFIAAHWNRSLALLKAGDFSRGWREYQWRYQCGDKISPPRQFPHPLWDGKPLNGKRILLHFEQGLGDTIQFVRYAPLVAQLGGKVLLDCQPELHRLMKSVSGIDRVLPPGKPLPPFAVQCPLMSLPMLFDTQLQTIPNRVPYLRCDPKDSDYWGQRLSSLPRKFRVGLCWVGRSTHKNDRNRSMPLRLLSPLWTIPDTQFFNLQKGPAAQQIKELPADHPMIDFTSELSDFAATAALIDQLDLVISVDTAIVHLAGAIGKATWVMLAFSPDFRWMLDRKDSPWYPTMRLFRQASMGDWEPVIQHIADELLTTAKARKVICDE